MNINDIIDYVLNTPGNTNAAVLKSLINTYAKEYAGSDDDEEDGNLPLPPAGSDIIYDGGEEV